MSPLRLSFPPPTRPRPSRGSRGVLGRRVATRLLICGVAGLLILRGATPLTAQPASTPSVVRELNADGRSEETRFAAGLRQRRLFDLAEGFCEQELSGGQRPPGERAELLIELLRTYAQHALHAKPAERPALWDKARAATESFLRNDRDNPKRFLVEFQQGIGLLAQGRLARQEAEVGGDATAMPAARDQTRAAIRAFERLLNELEREIPNRRRGRRDDKQLTADELFALQNQVLLQLGKAYENQALCYPPQSDDRLAALTIALEHLAEPVKQLPAGEPLVAEVRWQQARCLRLRGDLPQAERLLAALAVDKRLPPKLRQQTAAERARIRLASNRPLDAIQILDSAGKGPEVDFARLETLAFRIQSSSASQAQADTLRKDAIQLVNAIEDQHGAYWGRRASQLLVRVAGDAEGGAGIEILLRTADAHFLKGELDEALIAYDKTAERAMAVGQMKAAFESRVKAALIEQQRGDRNAYAQRLRDTAVELAAYEKANDAHLTAIAAVIGLARSDPQQLKRYETLLAEHLDLWPARDSADRVRMWLGKMRAAQRKWPEAIQAYGAVDPGSDQFGSAVRAIAPIWRGYLRQLQLSGQPTNELAKQAADYFESLAKDADGNLPQTWSELDRIAVLTAAQIRIRYRVNDFAAAEQLLKAGLQTSADDPAWTRAARAWLIVALAGQGRAAEAAQWINTLAGAEAEDLYHVVTQLNQIADATPAAAANSLAQIQQEALRLLAPATGKLSDEQQRTIKLIEGETQLRAGRPAEARAILAKLAADNPRRGDIQEAYAKALSARAETAQAALDQWRIVASRSGKETPRWYRAKYHVALALVELGQSRDAANRIRYLQQTSKLDTPLKAKFTELLKRAESR